MDLGVPALGVQELEAAINDWRARQPAGGNGAALSAELASLATVYALMIFHGLSSQPFDTLDPYARQLITAWRAHS